MKRVRWGWLLPGGMLVLAWIAIPDLDRRVKAADQVLQGMKTSQSLESETTEEDRWKAGEFGPSLDKERRGEQRGGRRLVGTSGLAPRRSWG